MEKTASSKVLVPLALAASVLIVYPGVVQHEFINFDDNRYILENPHVQNGLTLSSIAWSFTTPYLSNWFPLTWISHLLDISLFGMNPGAHHATSVIIHCLTTILLFFLVRSMTGATWKSGFVAALFALHPMHVESVAWIAERKDVLCGLFWVLTVQCYIWFVRKRGTVRYGALVGCFLCGLMSKPMAITLPLVLLFLDFWPLRRARVRAMQDNGTESNGPSVSFAALLWEKAPLFMLSLLSGALTLWVQHKGGAMASVEAFPFWDRCANAVVSIGAYLWKMAFPFDLSVFYPYPDTIAWGAVLLSLCFIAGTTVIAFRYATRMPYLITGWGWYLVMLVPVIGLVQVGSQSMADRYTYLPFIGPFIALTWAGAELSARWRNQRMIASIFAGSVLMAFAVLSTRQAGYWKDSATLFAHAISVSPQNPIAHNNLGVALSSQGLKRDAVKHFEEAIRLDSSFSLAHRNAGYAYEELGSLPDAVVHFKEAFNDEPGNRHLCEALGLALEKTGRSAEAVTVFQAALGRTPGDYRMRNNLGTALERIGRHEEAISQFDTALILKPDDVSTLSNRGNALAAFGRTQEAVGDFTRALRLAPDNVALHNNMGLVLEKQGMVDRAIHHYSRALQTDPKNVDVLNNCAAAFEKRGAQDSAVALYLRALSLAPDNFAVHNNLGLLLARQGKVEEAILHFREALRLRPDFAVVKKNLASAQEKKRH